LALKIRVNSFSYIYGQIPEDDTGNGGGFVFDCRFIYNPGRIDDFGDLTGKDEEVNEFLDKQADMVEFLENVNNILDKVVINYIERNFTDLMVSFGCTGGQHRSVYAAEKTAIYLRNKFPETEIILTHNEFPGL